ncbi:MAG: zf-HC2 domain-containing protein [Clostridiales bacterium]
MKACGDIRELITLYLDNDLNKYEKIAVEEHLLNCPDCKVEFEEIKILVKACENIGDEEVQSGFTQSLHNKLVNENNAEQNDNKLIYKNKYFRVITSIAAIFLLVVFIRGTNFYKIHSYVNSLMNMENENESADNNEYDKKSKNALKDKEVFDDDTTSTPTSSEPKETMKNEVVESTKSPIKDTPTLEEYSDNEVTTDVPKSLSDILIQSDTPEVEEKFIRNLLQNDNVKIDYESNQNDNSYYLVLKFKYENRNYANFINSVNQNIKANMVIKEENIDSDLIVIESLEEQKEYYESLLNSENEEYIKETIKEIDVNISAIKSNKYYTEVKIELRKN